MRKTILATALGSSVLAMSGCANMMGGNALEGPANSISSRPAAASVNTGVDWNWIVSGDRAVRPLQVFSSHGKTYLQMRPTQMLPAILVNGQPVPFQISAPYIVVQGKPDRMEVVADGYRSIIAHKSTPAPIVPPAVVHPDTSRLKRVYPVAQGGEPSGEGQGQGLSRLSRGLIEPAAVASATPLVVASAQEDSSQARVWRVLPREQTLSHALSSWSQKSGMPLKWQAPVDVPIVAAGDFQGSYMLALGHALEAASSNKWRFVMSLKGNTVIVNAIENQA